MNICKRPPYQKGQKRSRARSQDERDDAAFLEWLRTQPSCLSGQFSEFVNGQGRNVAAHVRRAANAGVAIKPLFSAVPLTDEEHKIQHQHGEHGLLNRVRPEVWDRKSAARWFDEQVKLHLVRWRRARKRGNRAG